MLHMSCCVNKNTVNYMVTHLSAIFLLVINFKEFTEFQVFKMVEVQFRIALDAFIHR